MELARELGHTAIKLLGYPSPVVTMANRRWTGFDISIGSNVSIGRLCHLSGDITLSDGVVIGNHTHLRGNITLDEKARLRANNTLSGNITVGRHSNINGDATLDGTITIGRYCAIGPELIIQQQDHEMDKPAIQMRFYDEILGSHLESVADGPVELGSDVWIGHDVTILSDVSVGHGAVIGAGAVVTDDIEPYAIVGGVPAKRIGWRFPQSVREELLDVASVPRKAC